MKRKADKTLVGIGSGDDAALDELQSLFKKIKFNNRTPDDDPWKTEALISILRTASSLSLWLDGLSKRIGDAIGESELRKHGIGREDED